MKNEEIVDQLLLVARSIGYGEKPLYQHNECFTSGAFDGVVLTSGDPAKNFDLLSIACDRYDLIKGDSRYIRGYIYLLEQMARSTRTTELPEGMKTIIQETLPESASLKEWYRIKS